MNLSPHLLCEEEAHPRAKILRFAGEADFMAVPAVRQLLKKLLGQRIPFLIVDLSGVTFLNTPFWAALQRYQIDGHPNLRLALCGMNEALKAAFDRVNAALPRFATVKKFTVMPREFSEAEGEVTPSQKLKRKVIEAHHREALDRM